MGTYSYPASGSSSVRPHAVSSITGTVNGVVNPTYTYDANGNMIAGDGRTITPTSFNMTASIVQGSTSLCLTYDSEHARIIQVQTTATCASPGSGAITTTYLNDAMSGAMSEKYLTGGTTTWRDYVAADNGLVAERFTTGGTTTVDYVVADHLGSTSSVTNSAGTVLEHDSYDAWGLRRNANGTDASSCNAITSVITRGFTEQEHMDPACTINFNARLYDPTIARFMSADSMVPDPFDGQSFNRFSYVNNGPLSATDPSGHSTPDLNVKITRCKDCITVSGSRWSPDEFVVETDFETLMDFYNFPGPGDRGPGGPAHIPNKPKSSISDQCYQGFCVGSYSYLASESPITNVVVVGYLFPDPWGPFGIFGGVGGIGGTNGGNTVTVWFELTQLPTHVGFQFNNGRIVGFQPVKANDLRNIITETFIHPVPGNVVPDSQSEFQDSLTFQISSTQLSAMEAYYAANQNAEYSTFTMNCAEFASNVLAAGGIYSSFDITSQIPNPIFPSAPLSFTPFDLDAALRASAINTGRPGQ